MESKTNTKLLNLFIAIVSVGAVAIISSVFTKPNSEWYINLVKPSQWTPDFLFPVMWAIIYSLFIVYIFIALNKKKLTKEIIILLSINGFLNILWCLTYFTLNSLIIGLVIIIINLFTSIILLNLLKKENKIISYILLIYPIWLSIATFLNAATWILN